MTVLPLDWKKYKFGEVLDIKSGYGFKKAEYSANGIPLIQIENVSHGFIKWENMIYLPEKYASEYPDLVLGAGDILIALNRPITQNELKVARLSHAHTPAILYQRVGKIVSTSDRIDYGFIFYLLQRELFVFVSRKSIGSDQPYISLTELRDYPLCVPPLPEQHKIAQILSTWDEAIAKTEHLITALRERKKGLMQRLLTGEVRFAGFTGKWRKTELGEFFYSFSKKNSANEDLIVLSCSTIHGIVPQTVIFGKRVASEDIRRYKVVERGDLIYDPMLLWDASIGFLEIAEKGVISPAYNTFKFHENSGNREYFNYLLKTHYYRQHYKYISQGTNVRRKKAPAEAFLKLKVVMPPTKEEQDKITDTLKACDREIELVSRKLGALKQQKKGLMQKLLTGQIRVKV